MAAPAWHQAKPCGRASWRDPGNPVALGARPSPRLERDGPEVVPLLAAPLDSDGDAGLRRLVESSRLSVHLICDLSHRLLAASPARFAEWHGGAEELRGVSLWRFATDEIRSAEGRLAELGWYEEGAASLSFWTGANHSSFVPIDAGILLWERLQLSDGTLARLVTSTAQR